MTVHGRPIELTATEFKLLRLLMERRGRVQTREHLLINVWNYETEIETRTVDTHIRRLREKLGPEADWIETIRGVGYRMAERKAEACSTLIIAALWRRLGVALKKLRDHRQAVRGLHQAIRRKTVRFFPRTRRAIKQPMTGSACAPRPTNSSPSSRSCSHARSSQLAQLEATLGSLQEAVLMVDAENRILLANQALQAIFPCARNILQPTPRARPA